MVGGAAALVAAGRGYTNNATKHVVVTSARESSALPQRTEQLDSHIRVLTPENIAFEYRLASPFERLLAYLIDLIVMSMMVAAAGLVAFLVFGAIGAGGVGFGMALILYFLVSWFYGGLFETFMNGQTPGKRSLGVRVVRTDGSPIEAGQAVLRNFLRVVDNQPMGTYLAGLIASSCNRRYQRLGDLACGTMVVAEDRSRVAKFNDIKDVMLSPVEALLPPDAMPSRKLAKAISHYVDRRRYFGPARRAEIARHVGEVVAEQHQLPPGIDHDVLLCALYRRAFLSQQREEDLELAARQANPYLESEAASPAELELPA